MGSYELDLDAATQPEAAGPPRVLVADDDADILAMVSTLLRREGYEVLQAANGLEALAQARSAAPDLLLLDVSMPDMDGYAVCRELRAAEHDPPPVIFLTARIETQDRVAGLDAGAVDYVVKPFSGAELRARVRAALRTKADSDRLRAAAATDALTGLLNRGQLGARVSELVSSARRYDRSLACLMIDVDHFKAVNDTYGHQAGDEVLSETARRLQAAKRGGDVLIRYGGEEFLALLPETDAHGAVVVAEKLRAAVADTAITYLVPEVGPIEIRVRVSIGVSCLDAEMYDGALLVAAADNALYRAKAAGRDRVVTLSSLAEIET
jgi:two-component system cell cycle response regulator